MQVGLGQCPHSQPLSLESLSSQAQRVGNGLSHLELHPLTSQWDLCIERSFHAFPWDRGEASLPTGYFVD